MAVRHRAAMEERHLLIFLVQVLAALAQAMLPADARGPVIQAGTARALRHALDRALRAQRLVRLRGDGPAAR